MTCSHAHDGIVNIRENFSTISSFFLLLVLISQFPTNELRVATNASKRLRIEYDSVTMSKNALGIWYESRTIFQIGEFVVKVLNCSKLLSRIPDRPTNCKNWLRTMRISWDLHELSTIQQRLQIFVNSWDSGLVWNRGISHFLLSMSDRLAYSRMQMKLI